MLFFLFFLELLIELLSDFFFSFLILILLFQVIKIDKIVIHKPFYFNPQTIVNKARIVVISFRLSKR